MYTKIWTLKFENLALPNLENYYKAAQLRPIAKWCDEEYSAKWKDIARKVVDIPTQSLIGNPKLSKSLQKSIDTIISHTLNIWFDFVKRQSRKKIENCWVGLYIMTDGHKWPQLQWLGQKRAYSNAYTNNTHIMNFQELETCHGLKNRDHFGYIIKGLVYKGITNCQNLELCNWCNDKDIQWNQTQGNLSSIPKFKRHRRYDKELNINITLQAWHNVCETQHTTPNSKTWREFSW